MESKILSQDLSSILDGLQAELDVIAGSTLWITGAAGFLGYYLVHSIVAWNRSKHPPIQLVLLDNMIRGKPVWLKELALNNQNRMQILEWDITHGVPANCMRADYILHAASIASPSYYRRYPLETMAANVDGLKNLLDYSLQLKKSGDAPKAILFFSSSEVYGDPCAQNLPTPEDYFGRVSFTGPRACYDESKRFCETLCVNYFRVHDLPVKIVRPFNNYGPGMRLDDGRVVADFVADILNSRNLRVFSSGETTRTFCYIADAVMGYFKAIIHGRNGEAYNIGMAGPEVRISELAFLMTELAMENFGYQSSVEYCRSHDKEYLVDNPTRRLPDVRKAKEELGFEARVSLRDGLTRTLSWFSETYRS